MREDVKVLRADLRQHDFAYLVPLADLHIEEPASDIEAFKGYVDWVAERDNAYIMLVGDLFTAATVASTPMLLEMRRDMMTPDEALDALEELLSPVASRIIATCSGGHELKNLFRAVGADYTLQLMHRLGRRQCYARDGGVLKMKTAPAKRGDDSFFTTVFTHGWGGARTRGAKIRKVEFLSQAFDADVYILAHDHTQNIARDNQLTSPDWDDEVIAHRKLYVNAGSFRGYAGYPLRAGYQPSDLGTPRIRYGKKVGADGRVRLDVHASL